MRLTLLAASMFALSSCGGSTAPDAAKQLSGDYNAVSVNGSPLPASYTVNYTFGGVASSYQVRVVARDLNLIGNLGIWSDSTEFTIGGVWQYQQKIEFVSWSIIGNQITVLSSNPQHGNFALFFTVQPDGTLVSTDNSVDTFTETVVYRRR